MKRLYEKNEALFAVLWIVVYVVGMSMADNLSACFGLEKSVSLAFSALLSAVLFCWIRKNGLQKKYGLCFSHIPGKNFLYYLPLILASSCNLWYGIRWNMGGAETALYVGTMFFVGFLEEVIFRGLLFQAMAKDDVKSAVIVSSVTFGIGHIVNLFNGSGMELVSNLCQIVNATAFGFLFVVLLHRGKSLAPCIAAHSTINMLSAFENAQGRNTQIGTSFALLIITVSYSVYLMKSLPPADENDHKKGLLHNSQIARKNP